MSLMYQHITASILPNNRETHVFVLAGQSNMRPATLFTGAPNSTIFPTNTFQWGRYGGFDGQLIPYTMPLHHNDNDLKPEYGPGIDWQFTRRYKQDNPNVNLVFIPCAKGGTGFIANDWNKGDYLYEDAVSRVNQCLTENPSFILKGILWHQGEQDVALHSNYGTKLDPFIANFREDIIKASSSTPFVLGGLQYDYFNTNSLRLAAQAVIEDTPNRISSCAFASSETPTILAHAGDTVHFSSEASVEFGNRYYEAYTSLL